MKKTLTLFLLAFATIGGQNVMAQSSSWSTGADLVSGYVWRGAKFGTGPAIQPTVEFSTGSLAIGAWGSYGLTTDAEENSEADLYASYAFKLSKSVSLTATLTDYYFPSAGIDYFNGEAHSFEPMLGLSMGKLSLTGAYMTNKSGNQDIGDTYLEAGYAFSHINVFLGAGNGQYTDDGDFDVCNIGIGTSKDLKITDSFTLPLFGSVIMNPSTQQLYIVVGLSL